MIIGADNQCPVCTHYQGDRKCNAYPEKIPDKLWNGDVVHDEPFLGDHGIQRDPKRIPPIIVDESA